ncbi:AAA family ATPase [Clostridium botulinum C]|uniref:AAA family ATPase n=1 Tax=Clostridium botulinum TaxID=1491 RepID=UPI001E2E7317|nr:AAA family ATPase [Clostridium botulinum]MCD3216913.1 AAA family ATPase [Clostridium botulinum C]
MADIIEKFKGKIEKCLYSKDDYKIYKIKINKNEYSNIKLNDNNEYIISGDVHNLVPNVEYEIIGKEIHNKYGFQYKILNVRRDKPEDVESSHKFLKEIITEKQAETLLSVYPDIINKVIQNDLNDIDLNLTSGIKEKTFNKIKKSIINNFCLIDLVDKFDGNISFSIVKKLYDKYTSSEMTLKKMRQDPYSCLCSLGRVGFKTADKILLSLEKQAKIKKQKGEYVKFSFDYDLAMSKQRMKACITYILEDNEHNGNTRIDIKEVRKQCNKLTPECINYFVDVIKETKEIHTDRASKTLSIYQTYQSEKYIAETILSMLKNKLVWNINTELYREDEGIKLTDEQMGALDYLCKYNVSILTAPAGSGKSQSVKMMVNMLENNNKSYLLMTPTGKAGDVLSEYTHRDAGTIHRQLKYNPKNKNPWTYNKENKLDVDVVFVDEFGMVDIYLMTHLLDAIDINKTKLVLVFDSYQLSSVGCGNVAHDLLMSKVIPTTILTKIFRYDEGGLMQIATKIRNSEKFLPSNFKGIKIFGSEKDYIYIERPQTKMIDEIIKIYSKLLKDGYKFEDVMVLSAYNKGDYGTKEINKQIQKLVQNNTENKYLQRGDIKFYKGDKVIQVTNNYQAITIEGDKAEVYNGNTGVIAEVNFDEVVVQFKHHNIMYTKDDLEQLELGYCISTHKSQGDNAKNIILITPRSHTYMLNSNLLYVGVTRGKKRVYHIGNIATINMIIKKKENWERDTFLKDLLTKLN